MIEHYEKINFQNLSIHQPGNPAELWKARLIKTFKIGQGHRGLPVLGNNPGIGLTFANEYNPSVGFSYRVGADADRCGKNLCCLHADRLLLSYPAGNYWRCDDDSRKKEIVIFKKLPCKGAFQFYKKETLRWGVAKAKRNGHRASR